MIAGAFALVVMGVAGCGTPGDGRTGTGSSDTSDAAIPATSAAAAIDPCQVLTSAEAAQLGLEGEGVPETLSGARGCGWNLAKGSFAITADEKSVDQLNLSGNQVEETSVRGVPAKVVRESIGPGDCAVVFPSSQTSSVQVDAAVPGSTDQACEIALQAAELVAANLPKS